MEEQYAVCCGIDVHKKLLVACLRTNETTTVRSYGASTQDLLDLADWLTANHCLILPIGLRPITAKL